VIRIVLDANAVGIDPPFGKIQHRLLLDAHRSGAIRLVVPQLALREAVNSWKSEVQSQEAKLAAAQGRLRELVRSEDWTLPVFDREAAAAALLEELGEALSTAGVETPPTPDADHDELVDKALRRRQPFDSSGSGYRDALLWQIVRNCANAGHDVVLVSNDCTAFGDGRKQGADLSQNLAAELTHGTVTLVSNLYLAVQRLGLNQDDAVVAAEATVQRLQANLAELLRDELVEELYRPAHKWDTRDIVNPFIAVGAALGLAFEALDATVAEARQMDDGRLEALIVLTVRQWVTVYIPTSLDGGYEDLGRVSDVNDEVVAREVEAVVDHHVRVVLDPVNDRLVSSEVVDTVRISR
jgi:hypothetical protein